MEIEWNYEDEWFEETNVSRKIRGFLVQNGYEIIKFCEDKREKGHDIEAIKDGRKIIMEVKTQHEYTNIIREGVKESPRVHRIL